MRIIGCCARTRPQAHVAGIATTAALRVSFIVSSLPFYWKGNRTPDVLKSPWPDGPIRALARRCRQG